MFCELKCDLCQRMFHMHRNVYPSAVGWIVLNMSVRSNWSTVSFMSTVYRFSVWMFHQLLKVFYPLLKSPASIILLSFPPFRCLYLLTIFRCSDVGCYICMMNWPFYLYIIAYFGTTKTFDHETCTLGKLVSGHS